MSDPKVNEWVEVEPGVYEIEFSMASQDAAYRGFWFTPFTRFLLVFAVVCFALGVLAGFRLGLWMKGVL